MRNKNLVLLLLSFCLCMCDNPRVKKDGVGEHEILLSQFPQLGILKYEDPHYFANCKVICLETTESSIIGEISEIELYDDKIYILDGLTYKLFIFNLEGHYLGTVGSMGQGPGEFIYITSFYIDEEMSVINVIDGTSSAVMQYDPNGNFLKKIKYDNPFLGFVKKAKVVGDNLFCYSVTNGQGNHMYVVLDKYDFSIIKEVRKYPGKHIQNRMFSFVSHPFVCIDGNVHFGALFSDTIFSYIPVNDTIIPYMVAKNKPNLDPEKLEARLVESDYNYRTVVKEIAQEDKYNIGIFNYFENKRYILWDFRTESSDKHAVLWDKKEKRGGYIEYGSYSPDFSSFDASFNNTVIREWNDFSISSFKEKLNNDKTVETNYPVEIIDLVKEYDPENDNPILILYEFKE